MDRGTGDVGLTYFARLPSDADAGTSASYGGVLGGFFGRWFRQAAETPEPSSSTVEPQPDSLDVAPSSADGLSEDADPVIATCAGGSEEAETCSDDRPESRESSVEATKLSERLSSLFRARKPSLVNYNRSDIRRYWMPDSTGKECYECQERFTAFRRRHHCRLCGQIFCAKCCNVQVPGSLLGYMGDLRLCGYCAGIVMAYLPQIETTSEGGGSTGQSESSADAGSRSDALISTVSVGPMVWSCESPMQSSEVTDGFVSESTPKASVQGNGGLQPSVRHPPSLLSVADLATHDSLATSVPLPPVTSNHVESYLAVDECEPEWVRCIEMTAADSRRNESFNKTEELGSMRSLPNLDAAGSEEKLSAETGSVDTFTALGSTTSRPKFNVSDTPPLGTSLERSFEERAQKLLLYLFEREMLDPILWWDVIWPVSKQVSSIVKVDIEGRKDNMNILKYVHVKKLCVDEPKPSASVIEGVVCSKSVAHGEMPSSVPNATVLALGGSIEYERVHNKLSSIEPIIMQESDYLSKQVERILANRPSVVLVERNVAHLAVQMLLRAEVTLISNLKTRVLYRIARSTHADVMPSLDVQVLQQKMGYCPLFTQHVVRLKNGKRKTLLAFSECPADLGCSVVLRGSSSRDLRCAKRILRYMILTLYSSRLEVDFLTLSGTTLTRRSRECSVCATNSEEPDPDPEGFIHRLKECTLSGSPLIDFGVPFLETARGRRCVLRPYFKQPVYRYLSKTDVDVVKKEQEQLKRDEDSLFEVEPEGYDRQHSFVENKALTGIDDKTIASYRAFSGLIFRRNVLMKAKRVASRKWSVEMCNRGEDVLDPFIHQRIAVLFGSFSAKSPNAPFFCVRPWVVQMEHYGSNDMCLGEFLRRFCFNKEYQCPSTNCDVPMLDHARKMVFRRVCIEILTQLCVQPTDDGTALSHVNQQNSSILVWHYCPCCKASSSVSPLTESAARLSFARYLDYIANGSYASCSVSSFNRECSHCCFHQHDHYFALHNFVTSIKVNAIRPYHVTFSPVVCVVEPVMFTRKFVAEKEEEIRLTADAIFRVIASQLERFSKNPDFAHYSSFHATLKALTQETRTRFDEQLALFDPTQALASDSLTIRSNDGIYIQAIDTVTRCQHLVQRMIDQWNEQSAKLAQAVRAFKKTASTNALPVVQSQANIAATVPPNGDDSKELTVPSTSDEVRAASPLPSVATEVELTPIDNPFLPQLHLTLPMSMTGVAAVVRDVVDRRGAVNPDVGSIIAYALSSSEYENKRRQLRDLCSTDGIPISLRSGASENDVVGNYEHVELDFCDDRAKYFVKIYYAERFHMLRKLLFVEGEDCFLRSLSVSTKWSPQGGKSGASFYRTQDDRFVFKQMSRFEIQSFVKFAPNYFNYVSTAVTENKLTTLCKVYGVYRIGYKNKLTGQQLKQDVLVMEYLFYKRNVKQVWDLKGSQRNRMASEGKRTADLVLLDENLVKDLWNNQLYVHPHSKAALNMAISNDSHFLSAQHVMDYSLLVGVDEANDELILGIVDYMRTYTLDKKLESWVKIVAIPGAHLPTVISPEMYCTRFSDAIDTYFPVAPDQWTGLGSAMSY